jgi:nucleotide-binding universal stress UspA family protein
MYRKIIVAVDMGQLEKGGMILRKAMALRDDGGEIVLLNVAEEIPGYLAIELPAEFTERNVGEARERLKALDVACKADAHVLVRAGSPAREIIAVAEETGADLIVVGSHRPNFSNYLIGSTADRVVRHATCSVLVDR